MDNSNVMASCFVLVDIVNCTYKMQGHDDYNGSTPDSYREIATSSAKYVVLFAVLGGLSDLQFNSLLTLECACLDLVNYSWIE